MQLDELYRQVIMDHYQHPRNQGKLDEETVNIMLKNPTCGDEIALQLLIQEGRVVDVRFSGIGCSSSIASASMMTEAIKGKTVEEALGIAEEFRKMMRGEEAVDLEQLGDLEALQGVSKFPARIKCATLAWNALQKATEQAR
jgi:nitrogen fixation protein NifU and related proteins